MAYHVHNQRAECDRKASVEIEDWKINIILLEKTLW